MRKLAAIAAIIAAMGYWSSAGLADEPPLDVGESVPLAAGCQALSDIIVSNGARFRYCRRASPDEVVGNSTVIHVRISTSVGDFKLRMALRKSLWYPVTTSEE